MNVFVLADDHEQRARYHCDTHVNKMLLEGAQLLNTALHINGADDSDTFYQPTHSNHPWVQWAGRCVENWEWLFEHTVALGAEFCRRSDSDQHATYTKIERNWADPDFEHYLGTAGGRTPFPQCMDDQYTIEDDPIIAYRNYYRGEKVPEDWCTWSTETPQWVNA